MLDDLIDPATYQMVLAELGCQLVYRHVRNSNLGTPKSTVVNLRLCARNALQDSVDELVSRRQFIFTRVYQAEQLLERSTEELNEDQTSKLQDLVDVITRNFNEVRGKNIRN